MRCLSLRFGVAAVAAALLASCTDAVEPTGPEPLRPAYVPAGSTVPLAVDAPLPLFHTGFVYLERYQSYVDTYHEALEVPAGLFRIDIHVEGLITLTERTGYMAPVTYGPGGAPDLFAPDGPRILSAGHGRVWALFVTSAGYTPNNWAPPHDTPHDTASVDGSWHVRGPGRLLVTRTQGIAPDSRYWSVEGAQRFSVYLTPVRQAEQQSVLSVRCESVTRGVIGACTASTSDNAPFQVTRWEFTSPPDPGSTESVRVTSETTDRSWRGPLVRSGTVTVKAMVNGREQNASTPLTVIDRDWSAKTADYSFRRIQNGEYGIFNLPGVVRYADDLGSSTWVPREPFATSAPQYTTYVPEGPNDNLEYFNPEETFHFYGYYVVNTAVMNSSSGFFRAQVPGPGRPGRHGGVNTCDPTVVTTTLEGLVDAHEKYHGQVYKATLDAHLGPALTRLERLTSLNGTSLYREYTREWRVLDSISTVKSLAVHNDSTGPGRTRLLDRDGQCALLNEFGQILTAKP